MNSFGKRVVLTTFGESHGPAMGGVLDGLPSGISVNVDNISAYLDRRRPGNQPLTSSRKETDRVEILSGISDRGVTFGSPIGFIIRNVDARSEDYASYEGKFRPNHADFTYYHKYGNIDWRGGGRASARETVNWVVGGALCAEWLKPYGINVNAAFIATIDVAAVAAEGDSAGGVVTCNITGLPIGIGEPVFDKLHARLAYAMTSINAVKAFEYGDGFRSAYLHGSLQMDSILPDGIFKSNHSGGIQGGISNGMPVNFNVYFKPTPTILQPVETMDVDGNPCVIPPKGRHDPCVAIRAVPVVEAMSWLVLADLIRGNESLLH